MVKEISRAIKSIINGIADTKDQKQLSTAST